MRFLAQYIMQGRTQAIMVASGFALLSLLIAPLSIVSSATIGLVTLRHGIKQGGYTLACAGLAAAILGFFLFGSYQFALIYSLLLWLPMWVIAIILREGRHLFLAIEIVVIIACLGIMGAYLYQPELGELWREWLNAFLEPTLIESRPDVAPEDIQQSLNLFYHFVMTGLIAQVYVFSLLAGLFLARWWQALLYNPNGFRKEYLSLRGQSVLSITSLVILCFGLLFSGLIAEICWNILVVLIVLYALLGSIILHCFFANLKMKKILVPFLYVTLVLIPYTAFPVAIIGLADTWLNLRNKIPNQPSS